MLWDEQGLLLFQIAHLFGFILFSLSLQFKRKFPLRVRSRLLMSERPAIATRLNIQVYRSAGEPEQIPATSYEGSPSLRGGASETSSDPT